MSSDNFKSLLKALIKRRPFRVFTVELHGMQRFEVDHSRAVYLRGGIAVFFAPGTIPIRFDHESVNFIVDAPAIDVPNGPHQ